MPPAASPTATLTINGTSFSPGTYQVSVLGTSASLSDSLPIPFSVGDYIIAGTQTLTAIPGATATANLTFTSEYSYSGKINLTCSATALPGAACALSPVSPITIGSGSVVPVTATVSVPNNAAVGTYGIKLTTQDSTGEPVHPWTLALTVQDFSFSAVTPPTQTVGAGQTATYNLSVMPVGSSFANPVTLSCAGAPANSTCSFTPNPVTPGSAGSAVVMTVATPAPQPRPALPPLLSQECQVRSRIPPRSHSPLRAAFNLPSRSPFPPPTQRIPADSQNFSYA